MSFGALKQSVASDGRVVTGSRRVVIVGTSLDRPGLAPDNLRAAVEKVAVRTCASTSLRCIPKIK
jgi:hypothetical protein